MKKFENMTDMIKEIQRILLTNDYAIKSVFDTTKYMKENLETSIEWCKKNIQEMDELKIKKGEIIKIDGMPFELAEDILIDEKIMKNLIYCEDTHSFVHRLYNEFKKDMPKNYRDAQEIAWHVIKEMNIELEEVKNEKNQD